MADYFQKEIPKRPLQEQEEATLIAGEIYLYVRPQSFNKLDDETWQPKSYAKILSCNLCNFSTKS